METLSTTRMIPNYLKDKLQKVVDEECEYAAKRGSSKLSVCDHYNWDRDKYNYRREIITAIQKRGFNVRMSVNHGVIDIVTTPVIDLNSKPEDALVGDGIKSGDPELLEILQKLSKVFNSEIAGRGILEDEAEVAGLIQSAIKKAQK